MLPHFLLLFTVIIWGWTFVATKILVAELHPVEIVAARLAIGIPVLGALLLAKRVPVRFTRADLKALGVGGSIFGVHFVIQAAGLVTTTATNTGWIIAVTPLALAGLSFVALGERIGRQGVAGIAIATAGIVLLVSRGRVADLAWLGSIGDWLILLSTVTWAVYTVATRNLVRRQDPLAVTLGIFAVAGVGVAAVIAFSDDLGRIRALSWQATAALLYLAIPGMAIGQWLWQEGVARLGAARAGLYLYLEPLSTVAAAVPLLGEPFGPVVIAGGGLVLAGVYVGQRGRNESRETVA